uniref:Reverse transcriptase Ty1/copia-type domain-containing protein n=1 Tax=Tanacetum cinerariifolium TaxID=118510 RepID=A0A6L2P3Q3_TANCI|nr:hypothetical protein [Tanacetum cinerariifolium]
MDIVCYLLIVIYLHVLYLACQVLWNGLDEYAYSVLEWIEWVRLSSIGMDWMGTPTQYWNGSDGYVYPELEWIGWVRLPMDHLVDNAGISQICMLEDAKNITELRPVMLRTSDTVEANSLCYHPLRLGFQLQEQASTDLQELIKNGNKVLTKMVGPVGQPYEPTTVEEKLDIKNEMKARGTLLMALLNKDQLKFHSYQDAKLPMESIEKRALKNQENRGREYGRQTVLVENPTENALIAQDGIGGYDWSYQADEERPTNFALIELTSSISSSNSDSEVDSCSKTCLKAYATLKEQYDSLSSDYKKYQFNLLSYRAGLESVEERLVHYKKNEAVFTKKNVLNLKVKLRDNALDIYIKNLEKAKKERDELKLTLETYQNSSKSLNTLLESQVSDKVNIGLEYKAASPVEETFVKSSEMLENQENVKFRSNKGYHAVPPPYTGNYIPHKLDLMFIDEQVESKSVDVVSTVSSSVVKTIESKVESVDIFDDESEVEIEPKVKDKIVRPSIEKIKFVKTARKTEEKGNPQQKEHKEKRVINSGCSRHMTGNKCYLTERLDESQVLLRVPRKDNIYSVDLKNVVPTREAVNIACYVLNRALVIKPHNKTPYELIHGIPPLIDFMKPFGCSITKDCLGKFDEKSDERFFVGYSMVIVAGFQTNGIVGTKDNIVAGQAKKKKEPKQDYIMIHISTTDPLISQGPKDSVIDAGKKATEVDASQVLDNGGQDTRSEYEGLLQQERQTEHTNSTNSINTISSPVSTDGPSFVNVASPSPINAAETPAIPIVTPINDTGIFGNAYDNEAMEEEVDMNSVVSSYIILDAPLTKFLKDRPKDQVIGSIETHVQIRQMTKINEEHGLISSVQKLRRTNHKDFQNCLFACYLSQMEPKKPVQALKYPSWVEAMLEELLLFKLLNVWTLVDLPKDKWKIVKTASTLMEPNKAFVKDVEAKDVDVHLYRSIIGSLMYLTTSWLDITFVVCACARFQVTPKTSLLHYVKRIFRYLKGQPKLGL